MSSRLIQLTLSISWIYNANTLAFQTLKVGISNNWSILRRFFNRADFQNFLNFTICKQFAIDELATGVPAAVQIMELNIFTVLSKFNYNSIIIDFKAGQLQLNGVTAMKSIGYTEFNERVILNAARCSFFWKSQIETLGLNKQNLWNSQLRIHQSMIRLLIQDSWTSVMANLPLI